MTKEQENLNKEILNKIEEYKKTFEDLSKQEKEELVYKLLLDMQLCKIDEKIDKLSIIKEIRELTDYSIGNIKSLLIYLYAKSYAKKVLYAKKYYKTLRDSYKNILKNYKNLADELHINSALELSHLFTYMLWNGYYSATKEHHYSMKDRILVINFGFLDIVRGSGVCLSYSECLQDYLLMCGKNASILSCKDPKEKPIEIDYKPQIEFKGEIKFKDLLELFLPPLILSNIGDDDANHAITLIKDNNNFFAYDPTNLLVLNIINKNTSEIINGKGFFKLYPIGTLCTNITQNSELLLKEFINSSFTPAFTRKEIIFSFENTMELIMNNIPLLDDAYDNIHSELQSIVDNYERLKVKSKIKKQ